MKVQYGFDGEPDAERSIASIGNFDGVHLGHQAILRRVVSSAKENKLRSVVITFDPVPKRVLSPATAPPLIQTLNQRIRTIEALQIETLIVVHFTKDFANHSPQEFIDKYLVEKLHVKELIVGERFSFGHQKQGNISLLKEYGKLRDFVVYGIPEVQINGQRISSTLIRTMIGEGDVAGAAALMGHGFALEGTVVPGNRLGATIGIPTANLAVENELFPGTGVYVVAVRFGDEKFHGITNVGFRPTIGGKDLVVESHLFDFHGDLYGKKIEVEFFSRVRDEKKFSNVGELKQQITEDIQQAKRYFQQHLSV